MVNQKKLYFENKEKENFEGFNNKITQFIKEDEIDIFLCLSINKILSNLGFTKYLEDNPNYKKS